MLGSRSSNLAIFLNEHGANDPSACQRQKGEACRSAETDAIARLVEFEPEVGTVDVSNLQKQLSVRK